jgi:hypothetical protein
VPEIMKFVSLLLPSDAVPRMKILPLSGSARIKSIGLGAKFPISELEAAAQAHAAGVAVGHDAKAVVLDSVNPASPRKRPLGGAGAAGFEAPDTARHLTQR